jgi:predicted transcriptional regulator of viral defense system
VSEPAKALQEHGGEFDLKALGEYSLRINNTGVVRRLGYLCDLYNIPISLPKITSRNYLSLDPTMPHDGDPDSEWRLKINIDLGELT